VVPATSVSFLGLTQADNVIGHIPPDTVGDVGPNHYVQQVNTAVAVFSKAGTRLAGPVDFTSFFAAFPPTSACRTSAGGDPITLYDPLAGRWMLSSFSASSDPHECIAVSQTADPTGAYWVYDFPYPFAPKFNDYPKAGIWSDAIYFSYNQFDSGDNFVGVGVIAYDKTKMYAGQAASQVAFDLQDGVAPESATASTLLPSDVDGTAPPGGAPDTYVGFNGGLEVWDFHVDFVTTANSTFTNVSALTVASLDPNMCGFSLSCIPQNNTTTRLDALSDRLMHRNAYRNFGTHQTMVLNQTVDVDSQDHAGVRWYELRKTSGAWSIFQQGTLESANDGGTFDGVHRWMGSVASDQAGDIALGYSASSSTIFPAIRYTGRLPGDAPGTLPQGEGVLQAGLGSQLDAAGFSSSTAKNRWGDYSAMSVDPSDDCTFWYTQEYYTASSTSGDWSTRIGSFKFPTCGGAPSSTPTLTVNDAPAVAEGVSADFNVTVGPTSPQPITFDASTSNGTALAGSDYSAVTNQQFTIPPNTASLTVPVPTVDDTTAESTESFGLTISNSTSGTAIGDNQAVGSITDNDASPRSITIDDVSVNEGGVATFTIAATSPGAPVNVTATTADASAVAPADYASTTQTVTVPGNAMTTSLAVQTAQDPGDEPNETFVVNLTGASPNGTIADAQGLGTVIDDDSPGALPFPTIDVVSPSSAVKEGKDKTGRTIGVEFTVRLSAVSAQPVLFDAQTRDDTALSGTDYFSATLHDVQIPAGQTSVVVVVPVRGDKKREKPKVESFFLDISNIRSGTPGVVSGTGSIVDDDRRRRRR
jgi:hypothetical protein